MPSINRYSVYDAIASTYNWEKLGSSISDIWIELLDKFILPYIPEKAYILDLGCGQGELAQKLLNKKYKVTGVDGSEEMLNYARENAPGGEFILDDLRSFQVTNTFHSVIAAGNIPSHILSLEELTSVFHNVYNSLQKSGWFSFDTSREEWFQIYRNGSEINITDDYVVINDNKYDLENKTAQIKSVWFRLINGEWRRGDISLQQRAYEPTEVKSILEKVGFTEVNIFDAVEDLGLVEEQMEERLMKGRMLYICRKQASSPMS